MIRKIFFVGIKGVGMTPLAIIAKQSGLEVSGSDTGESFITDLALQKNNISVYPSFDPSALDEFIADTPEKHIALITTGAHKGYDNQQVKHAKKRGITILTQGKALAEFMQGKIVNIKTQKGVSIAGSHGKTTTTAILATTLKHLGDDPSYVIGTGSIPGLLFPGNYGKGNYFVAEADEYVSEPVYDRTPKLLYHKPYASIITNIDYDHPDVFESFEKVIQTFKLFAKSVKDGPLIVCGDDKHLQQIASSHKNSITYGRKNSNTYIVKNINITAMHTIFDLYKEQNRIGNFSISVPGEHNALNAASAVIFLLYEGFKIENIKNALSSFSGTKRRLEKHGMTKLGTLVFDDYAHHPQEIIATINALKKAYPEKKIIAVFQSHTFSRTRALHKEFADSLKSVDELILLPIFSSAREKNKTPFAKEEYMKPFVDKCTNVIYKNNQNSVIKYIQEKKVQQDSIIVTIGAGDIYKIAESLVQNA